jgi:integrase
MTQATASPRRRKGEGSITRFHNHPTCPPVGPDGVRPEHRCQGPYRARVWVTTMTGQKVRKTVYGKTEREVIQGLKKLTAQEVTGTVVQTSATVKEWLRTDAQEVGLANYWSELAPSLKVNTRKGYVSKINQYILPHLGRHRLDRLTPEHVAQMYADMRKKGLAEATLRQTHAILSRALKVAMRRGKVSRNVCDLVDPPSTKVTKRRPLTVEDAWKVLHLCGDAPRFWVALMTGLRQGEALALRWSDIHLDGQPMPYLVVREAVSWDGGPVFDTPKSEQSTNRVVPLVTPVADRLRKAHENHVAQGGTEDDLVFANPRTGRAMDPRKDWMAWTVMLDLAGVPHTALHAARNTTAALLEDAGVPDRVVAEILGHTTVQMTHGYQAGNVAAKVEAMKALDEYMAGKNPRNGQGAA